MKKAILWSVAGVVAVAASVFTTISSIDPAPELTDLQKENLRILAALDDLQLKFNEANVVLDGTQESAWVKKKCYDNRTYTGKQTDTAYECGPTGGCITYRKFKSSGTSKGSCNALVD